MKWLWLFGVIGCGRVGFAPAPDAASDAADAPTMPVPDLWFRIDESSGNTLSDSGPLAAHVTLSGSFTWPSGRLRFTAPDSGGATPLLPGRFRQFPVTVSGWMQCAQRGDSTSVPAITVYEPFPPNAFSNDVPNQGGYGLGHNEWTDGTPGSAVMVGQGALVPVTGISCAQLRHVAVVYSDSQLDMFIDGAIAGSDAILNLGGESAAFFVGRHNDDVIYGTTRFYLGDLDDVRVYLAALSPAQIRALYDAGPI